MLYIIEHYSGDADAYNTPVRVNVDPVDLDRFVRFLDADHGNTWETLRAADPEMYDKYFTVRTDTGALVGLWPDNVFDAATYDRIEEPRPAHVWQHYMVTGVRRED